MAEDKHICGTCKRKSCPQHGQEKYDGMLGPAIFCMRYWPGGWSGIIFAPLHWLCNLISYM